MIEFPPLGGLHEGHTILEKYQIVMAATRFSK